MNTQAKRGLGSFGFGGRRGYGLLKGGNASPASQSATGQGLVQHQAKNSKRRFLQAAQASQQASKAAFLGNMPLAELLLNLIVGRGGVGKTSLIVTLAYALATGLQVGGFSGGGKPLRVAMVFVEETAGSVGRILRALIAKYGVTPAPGFLEICDSGCAQGLFLMKTERGGPVPNEAAFEEVFQWQREHDVLFLDNVAGFAGADQNSNIVGATIGGRLNLGSQLHNCTTVLVAHKRKGVDEGGPDAAVDSIMGGIALSNAARQHVELRTMGDRECKDWGVTVDGRLDHIGMSVVKTAGGRIDTRPEWLLKVPTSVKLADGSDATAVLVERVALVQAAQAAGNSLVVATVVAEIEIAAKAGQHLAKTSTHSRSASKAIGIKLHQSGLARTFADGEAITKAALKRLLLEGKVDINPNCQHARKNAKPEPYDGYEVVP